MSPLALAKARSRTQAPLLAGEQFGHGGLLDRLLHGDVHTGAKDREAVGTSSAGPGARIVV
jgi:hypothetical protein